jgi:hypothetical protein
MRAYEFAKLPVRIGMQPMKWVGGMMVNQATQVARANIIDMWRRPWEAEARQNLADARQQHDYSRAEEQRALLECIHRYAPHTAEEFEELKATASDKPRESQLDVVLGPTAKPPPND